MIPSLVSDISKAMMADGMGENDSLRWAWKFYEQLQDARTD